jgi:hypothetical protein
VDIGDVVPWRQAVSAALERVQETGVALSPKLAIETAVRIVPDCDLELRLNRGKRIPGCETRDW